MLSNWKKIKPKNFEKPLDLSKLQTTEEGAKSEAIDALKNSDYFILLAIPKVFIKEANGNEIEQKMFIVASPGKYEDYFIDSMKKLAWSIADRLKKLRERN